MLAFRSVCGMVFSRKTEKCKIKADDTGGKRMSNIIQINNLNKSFESVNAVQNLSFRVKKESCSLFLVSTGQESQLQSILCVDNYRKTVEAFLLMNTI